MQGPTPEEAAQWLRDHFRNVPEPKLNICIEVTESNPVIYREVMEILFGPLG